MNKQWMMIFFIGYALSLPKFPQIGYLGVGYDIFRGNPRANGVDYGFKLHPVLELTYFSGKETPDGLWLVPDNVTVLPTKACSYDSSSSTISGSYSYQESLLRDLKISSSVSISMFSAAFSASTSFQQGRSTFLSRTYRSVQATATCETYRAAFLGYNTSYVFSPEFEDAVKSLPTQYNPSTSSVFQKFYETFGTHVVFALTMGARMNLESVFEEDVYREMTESSVDIEATASLSFSIFSGSFSGSTTDKNKIEQNFDNKRSELHQIYIGGIPFVDVQHGGLEKWGAGAMENPMPMGGSDFQISYIGDLFTTQYFPKDKDIDSKRLALGLFYSQLCSTLPGCTNDLFDWPDASINTASWAATTSDGNQIYFISGIAGHVVDTVRALQINKTAEWKNIAPIPTPRSSAAAIWVDNPPFKGIFVFGGDNGEDNGHVYTSIDFYNEKNEVWFPLSQNIPYPVSGIHCGLLDNSIIIPGGFTYINNGLISVYSSVIVYHLSNSSTSILAQRMPTPVYQYAMVEFQGCLWVIGGRDHNNNAVSDTQILCDVLGPWKSGPRLRIPRVGAAAAVVDGSIYVLGGLTISNQVTSKEDLLSVEVYVPTFGMWGTASSLQFPQFGTDAYIFHDNYILIVGGGVQANQLQLYPLGERRIFFDLDGNK